MSAAAAEFRLTPAPPDVETHNGMRWRDLSPRAREWQRRIALFEGDASRIMNARSSALGARELLDRREAGEVVEPFRFSPAALADLAPLLDGASRLYRAWIVDFLGYVAMAWLDGGRSFSATHENLIQLIGGADRRARHYIAELATMPDAPLLVDAPIPEGVCAGYHRSQLNNLYTANLWLVGAINATRAENAANLGPVGERDIATRSADGSVDLSPSVEIRTPPRVAICETCCGGGVTLDGNPIVGPASPASPAPSVVDEEADASEPLEWPPFECPADLRLVEHLPPRDDGERTPLTVAGDLAVATASLGISFKGRPAPEADRWVPSRGSRPAGDSSPKPPAVAQAQLFALQAAVRRANAAAWPPDASYARPAARTVRPAADARRAVRYEPSAEELQREHELRFAEADGVDARQLWLELARRLGAVPADE